MAKIFRLENDVITPDASQKILKKDDLSCLYEANSIISFAKQKAIEIEDKAKEAYELRYQEGLEIGKEEGKEQYTFKIMETVLSSLDSLQGLEQELVALVIDAVEKIVGQLDDDDLVRRIVRRGLACVRGEHKVIVRVSLEDEKIVREDLKAFLISEDGSSGYADVVADSSLKHLDCIIETSLGVVESSLDNQLRILKQALEAKVQRREV